MAEETTKTTTEENKTFKAWLIAFFGAILSAICTFFLCKHTNKNFADIRGGFQNTREQLNTASSSISTARENTAQLDTSARECEQRVTECQQILKRVREQNQQSTK